MLALRKQHLSVAAIGKIAGVTRQRVNQIIGNTGWQVLPKCIEMVCAMCGKRQMVVPSSTKKFCGLECKRLASLRRDFLITKKNSEMTKEERREYFRYLYRMNRDAYRKRQVTYYQKNREKLLKGMREYSRKRYRNGGKPLTNREYRRVIHTP